MKIGYGGGFIPEDNSIKEALLKCAKGLSASETVEEFAVDTEGELKLVRKKVTTRDIPPDLKAVKLLLEERTAGNASDGELEEERKKLLKLLDGEN